MPNHHIFTSIGLLLSVSVTSHAEPGIDDLEPITRYEFEVQSRIRNTINVSGGPFSFTTAPAPDSAAPLSFTVSTCQQFGLRDDPDHGHKIYHSMLKLNPAFLSRQATPLTTSARSPCLKTWNSPAAFGKADGPEKFILGKQQWARLENTMKASDATFKLYISATPVVGPDRKNKNDNHAKRGFHHEGERLRNFLHSIPGCMVINGDRLWQNHSVDSQTGLHEFG